MYNTSSRLRVHFVRSILYRPLYRVISVLCSESKQFGIPLVYFEAGIEVHCDADESPTVEHQASPEYKKKLFLWATVQERFWEPSLGLQERC